MSRTAFAYHERFLDHDTGPHHPERPDRLRAILRGLQQLNLLDRLDRLEFEPAADDLLLLNHSRAYVERLAAACDRGDPYIDCPDSAICRESESIARLAVGAVVAAVDAVMTGRADNAFCAVRPPGHHARRDVSAGFCLYNNIAIAARRLQSKHDAQRVMILDWDVHHGDGTQASFEEDPTVLMCSLHEDPRYCYPGTGFAHERGRGPGEGFTVNLPMPVGARDEHYMKAYEDEVLPHAHAFRPEVLLISDGFDAHRDDPLAGVELSDHGFAWLMTQAVALARELCGGRLIVVLEGGYNLGVLERCAAEHLRIILG
ncbi:histone deacetylase [Sphingobacteriales bacterium CHB3]|nr:histone deacetylase [Sphingobacteriales bacterium CHB3]